MLNEIATKMIEIGITLTWLLTVPIIFAWIILSAVRKRKGKH